MTQQFLYINSNIVQKNRLSPSSIQYLKVLQLNQSDLIEYIDEELLSNPLLDGDFESGLNSDDLNNFLKSISPVYDNFSNSEDQNPIENSVKSRESLYDHLTLQLDLMKLSPNELRASKIIVCSLNASGYLDSSLEELSTTFDIDLDELSACLSIVQSLEPQGVGATSLSECLILQLDRDDSDFNLLSSIISNHLDLVASNKLQTLSKKIQLPLKKLNTLLEKISLLDPKPGLSYGDEVELRTEYIVPEIFLTVTGGKIEVDMPDSLFPRLRINNYYRKLLSQDSSPSSKEFLANNLNRAIMLVKNLEQRRNTVKCIAMEIASHQEDFFLHNMRLKPLNLKEIAESIDMHESTVSRAIKDKYLHCQFGVFPLKYFFSNKSVSSDGDDRGSLDVKRKLEDIIASEDPYNPYSDSDLSKILSTNGISVARRTVAKYRESLCIKSSRARRKYK